MYASRSNDSVRLISALLLAVVAAAALGVAQVRAMVIYVTVMTDSSSIQLDVEPNDTIDQVKAKIQDSIGMLPEQQVLMFNGEPLADGQTLADYGVAKDGTLQLYSGATSIQTVGTTLTAVGSSQVLAKFNAGPTCTSATLTVYRVDAFPTGTGTTGMLPVYWNITSDCAGAFNLDLKLCYTEAQLAAGLSVTESGLEIYKNETGSSWTRQGGTADPANNCVTLGGVTTLSNWTLYDPSVTAVQLERLSASAVPSIGLPMALGLGLLTLAAAGWVLRRRAQERKPIR